MFSYCSDGREAVQIPVRMLTLVQQKINSVEAENAEWRDKYGADAAKMIRTVVDENIPHYEYLKQFALKV